MTETLSGELKAMSTVEAAFKDLEDDEIGRVMQWANSKFKGIPRPAGGKMEVAAGVGDDQEDHPDLATLFSAAAPANDAEKALVGAYWLQYREGAADVGTQAVNMQLKQLGHGIGNATRAFETLKAERPALIVQTKKAGSTQQARKKFKVTHEGMKKVEAMLQKSG